MAVAAVLTLYIIFLWIGVAGARKALKGGWSELLVAGRAMPLWLAVLTMTATWVDGGYLLGTVEGTVKSGIPLGAQGGLCFGASLILGGIVFARRMRRFEFTTLIDPFEARFGRRWAMVLTLPALAGEVFWSAELLVAIGSTFGVMLGLPLGTAILLSAVVVTTYTMLGGLWSVAYTDAFQLGLVALGLLVAVPVVFHVVGGFHPAWAAYVRGQAPWCLRDPAMDARHVRVDRPGHHQLVGRQRDARARRDPVELLFPAGALVSDAGQGPVAFDPGRPAHHRLHDPAAAARHRGLLAPLARAPRRRDRIAARRGDADDLPLPDARVDRRARPGCDHWRSHVELQRVDPVGRFDGGVERRLQAVAAGPDVGPARAG